VCHAAVARWLVCDGLKCNMCNIVLVLITQYVVTPKNLLHCETIIDFGKAIREISFFIELEKHS